MMSNRHHTDPAATHSRSLFLYSMPVQTRRQVRKHEEMMYDAFMKRHFPEVDDTNYFTRMITWTREVDVKASRMKMAVFKLERAWKKKMDSDKRAKRAKRTGK